jgi:hypothetical protein
VRIAIVTDVERGMRWTRRVAALIGADEGHGADGEIVWSWRPGADAKVAMFMTSIASDGGKNAGPRGERV